MLSLVVLAVAATLYVVKMHLDEKIQIEHDAHLAAQAELALKQDASQRALAEQKRLEDAAYLRSAAGHAAADDRALHSRSYSDAYRQSGSQYQIDAALRQREYETRLQEARALNEQQAETARAMNELSRQRQFIAEAERERMAAANAQQAQAARDRQLQELQDQKNRVGQPPAQSPQDIPLSIRARRVYPY